MIFPVRLLLAIALIGLPPAGALAEESAPDAAGKRIAFGSIDTDQDGRISLEEFKAGAMERVERQFKWMDSNGDQYIDRPELEAVVEQIHKRRGVPGAAE